MTGLPPSVHLMVDNAVVRSQPKRAQTSFHG